MLKRVNIHGFYQKEKQPLVLTAVRVVSSVASNPLQKEKNTLKKTD